MMDDDYQTDDHKATLPRRDSLELRIDNASQAIWAHTRNNQGSLESARHTDVIRRHLHNLTEDLRLQVDAQREVVREVCRKLAEYKNQNEKIRRYLRSLAESTEPVTEAVKEQAKTVLRGQPLVDKKTGKRP